jgi:hypothetical protein
MRAIRETRHKMLHTAIDDRGVQEAEVNDPGYSTTGKQ